MKRIYSVLRIPYVLLKRFTKNINYFVNKFFFALTQDEIMNGLEKVGLKKGMIVYVHSSMSSFGYVNGGPNSVISPILNIIGNEGIIVVPTFTHRTDIFDIETTKSWTGAISESLRLKKGSFRSVHPTHSVTAFGLLAKEIIKGHEKSKSPFDEKSPFHKLAVRGSYILMLGTENNSMIHYVQNKVNFPNLFLKKDQEFKYKVNNKIKIIKTKIHHPNGSIKYIYDGKPCSDVKFLVNMYRDEKFEEKGYMKTIKIGSAVCRLINTQNFIRTSTKYLENNIKRYKNKYQSLIKNG